MSLKTAGIREFARMIGRSHSWVVSQCQRNIIPKTTDGKIPVDDALKIVAQLFAAVRARESMFSDALSIRHLRPYLGAPNLIQWNEAHASGVANRCERSGRSLRSFTRH